MRLWRQLRPAVRIGLALGPDRLTAVTLRRGTSGVGEAWSRALEPSADGTAGWEDLVPALEELRELIPPGRVTLRIALLPPLAQTKRIELPRLRIDELRRVVTRDSGRYFAGKDVPRVVSVMPCGKARTSPAPYLVSVADARVVDAVFRAAARLGWSIGSIAPAYPAWQAAAIRRWPELVREDGCVAILVSGRVEKLRLERGRLTEIRRFRQGEAAAVLESANAAALTDSVEALAAMHAAHGRGMELIPECVREERARRAGRLSGRLISGAAALLVLSAGAELWGAHRELNALRARRATLRPRVAEAMSAREQLDGLQARLRALAGANAAASRWTAALASTADHLPRTAYLVDLRGEADTLVLEGVAQQAAQVFEQLGKAPGFLAVRATAPIRQEAADSGAAIERFTLSARFGGSAAREP